MSTKAAVQKRMFMLRAESPRDAQVRVFMLAPRAQEI